MTVAELIRELGKYCPNISVRVLDPIKPNTHDLAKVWEVQNKDHWMVLLRPEGTPWAANGKELSKILDEPNPDPWVECERLHRQLSAANDRIAELTKELHKSDLATKVYNQLQENIAKNLALR